MNSLPPPSQRLPVYLATFGLITIVVLMSAAAWRFRPESLIPGMEILLAAMASCAVWIIFCLGGVGVALYQRRRTGNDPRAVRLTLAISFAALATAFLMPNLILAWPMLRLFFLQRV